MRIWLFMFASEFEGENSRGVSESRMRDERIEWQPLLFGQKCPKKKNFSKKI